jgi:Flp pilus assembly protein TadD
LNAKGLAEFNKENFTEAAASFERAAAADPADVEIMANLGYALLKAGRAQEAKKPLRDALAIDPRRASAWAALADTLFETGDDDGTLAALLLTHEFSENREKIIAIFKEKTVSSERSASLYAQALKKIHAQQRNIGSALN